MRQIDMPDAAWMLLHSSFRSPTALRWPQEPLSFLGRAASYRVWQSTTAKECDQ